MKEKIALIQMKIEFKNIKKNYKNYKNYLKLMKKSLKDNPDIIVLPELFDVVFFPKKNLKKLASENKKFALKFFGKFAKKNRVNIIASSILNLNNNKIY